MKKEMGEMMKKTGLNKKITAVALLAGLMAMMFAGCGNDKAGNGDKPDNLEGSCEEVLVKVYENAELAEDMRDAMQYYETTPIDESSKEYILGTADVNYTDSVYSAPMMSSVAYQCVLLRVEEGQDIDAVKQVLSENADPNKWICVEAESVVVENVGDMILFIMADTSTANAVKDAFLAMGEA